MRQSELSKRWMAQALLKLMKEKTYSKITIREITEKAGISRLTFYRNFETKSQILQYYIQDGFEKYMEIIHEKDHMDLETAVVCCFQFWAEKADEIRLFIKQDLSSYLLMPFESCFHQLLEELDISHKYTYFQCQFLVGGMFESMLAWVDDPKNRTSESITSEIMELVTMQSSE